MVNSNFCGSNENNLDDLYIKILELMDKIIDTKIQLEDIMKNGFFMMGKSRYIMGSNSVSAIQIPTEDCAMKSIYNLKVLDESLSATDYKSFVIQENKTQLKSTESSENKGEELTLRKRTGGQTSVEEVVPEEKVCKNVDAINWFSALPPQTLRQSQKYFKEAILKIAEIATLQSKLDSYRKTSQALKNKIDTI